MNLSETKLFELGDNKRKYDEIDDMYNKKEEIMKNAGMTDPDARQGVITMDTDPDVHEISKRKGGKKSRYLFPGGSDKRVYNMEVGELAFSNKSTIRRIRNGRVKSWTSFNSIYCGDSKSDQELKRKIVFLGVTFTEHDFSNPYGGNYAYGLQVSGKIPMPNSYHKTLHAGQVVKYKIPEFKISETNNCFDEEWASKVRNVKGSIKATLEPFDLTDITEFAKEQYNILSILLSKKNKSKYFPINQHFDKNVKKSNIETSALEQSSMAKAYEINLEGMNYLRILLEMKLAKIMTPENFEKEKLSKQMFEKLENGTFDSKTFDKFRVELKKIKKTDVINCTNCSYENLPVRSDVPKLKKWTVEKTPFNGYRILNDKETKKKNLNDLVFLAGYTGLIDVKSDKSLKKIEPNYRLANNIIRSYFQEFMPESIARESFKINLSDLIREDDVSKLNDSHYLCQFKKVLESGASSAMSNSNIEIKNRVSEVVGTVLSNTPPEVPVPINLHPGTI